MTFNKLEFCLYDCVIIIKTDKASKHETQHIWVLMNEYISVPFSYLLNE